MPRKTKFNKSTDTPKFTKERADFIRKEVAQWVKVNQPKLKVTDIDKFIKSGLPIFRYYHQFNYNYLSFRNMV